MNSLRLFLFVVVTISYSCVTQSEAQENILSKKDTAEVRFINNRKFFIYKVSEGETMYSISKKFKIPQEEINEFNPELKDGLKLKMKLWVPAFSHQKKEQEIQLIPEKTKSTGTFQVALFTAINLDKQNSADSSSADTTLSHVITGETIASLEFYEGILIALDSLKAEGIKTHIYLYDHGNDPGKTGQLLQRPELKKMNLIISQGNASTTRIINTFSRSNGIQLASCSMNVGELMKDNKHAIAFSPSSLTQCKEMGKVAAEKFSQANCIVLKTLAAKENDRTQAFISGWMNKSEKKIKEIDLNKYQKSVTDSLNTFFNAIALNFSKDIDNLVFVPSSNEEFVSTFVNGMKEYSEKFRITLIGLPTWPYFETIDPLLMELLNVHVFMNSMINYNNPSTIIFRKKFYDRYNIEPMDGAYQGFDLMMIAGKNLLNADELSDKTIEGLFTSYRFTKTSDLHLENEYINVCKYRNYSLKKINE